MKIRLFLVAFILTTLLAPASWAAQEKETIVFWYGATQEERVAYEQMIADFERTHPNIEVNAMLVPQSYMERKLILSVAGGVPPDVVRFYAHLGGEMMSRGGLERLDELAVRDNFDLNDFYPVGLKQNTYEGKLYGIPWVLSPDALFYNKELFREVGLDPNKPPKTWEELEAYAMKLTERDKNGVLQRVGFADFLYNPKNFSLYLWQSGGELLGDQGLEPKFNSETGKETLRWMKSFLERETGGVKQLQTFAASFKGATQDPFGQGKVAMRIDSPFRIPDIKKYFPDLDFAVAPVPYNKQRAIEVVGNSLVIPKGSKHKDAAWEFIKFASSREQITRIAGVGRIPARISAAKSEKYYSDPLLRPFIDQIPYGHSVPIIPGWQEVSDVLARNIEAALTNEKSVEVALDDAAAASEQILSKANEDMTAFAAVPWKVIAIFAALLMLGVISGTTIFVRKHTHTSKKARDEAKQFFIFASPWIIGFIVLTFGAIAASLVISFSKWDTLSAARFIGFRNYIELFTSDPRFYKAIFVTFYYAVFSVPLAIIGGLIVSVLLNQNLFGTRIFRTIYYLPVVISGVATSVLWQYIFNPSSGLLNKFLSLNVIPTFRGGELVWTALVQEPLNWLGDAQLAMPAFIIMGLWSVGGAMVIYLAALQGIPEELYEAAKIDGAGAWKTFRNVTLPLLTPAIFYQLIVGTMYSLQMFTQPYIMTPTGGPKDATLFYGLYLFKNSFEWLKLGYGSAMAWILFVIVLSITLIHFKAAARWVYYEGTKEK